MKTDNELIAEFMGETLFDYGADPVYIQGPGFPNEPPIEAEYHTSWDWLMPVVEKIDSLGYFVTIMKTRTTIAITLNVQNHIQSIHPGYSMIEVVYKAVVEFIKWHNSQNQ